MYAFTRRYINYDIRFYTNGFRGNQRVYREQRKHAVAVVFEATRYVIKLYHHRQHKKYTVRDIIKEVV